MTCPTCIKKMRYNNGGKDDGSAMLRAIGVPKGTDPRIAACYRCPDCGENICFYLVKLTKEEWEKRMESFEK